MHWNADLAAFAVVHGVEFVDNSGESTQLQADNIHLLPDGYVTLANRVRGLL